MKRSSSVLSTSDEDHKPRLESPSTPKKRGAKSTSASPGKKPKASPRVGQVNGTWTSEKKARFMDIIIANGYKSTNLDQLSTELEMSKRQLIDQLIPNKKGTCRDKAVEAIRGQK